MFHKSKNDPAFHCRLCIKQSKTVLRPASDYLKKIIHQYIGLNLFSNEDGLPEGVCPSCSHIIFVFHEYAQLCIQTQNHMKEFLLFKNYTIHEYDSEDEELIGFQNYKIDDSNKILQKIVNRLQTELEDNDAYSDSDKLTWSADSFSSSETETDSVVGECSTPESFYDLLLDRPIKQSECFETESDSDNDFRPFGEAINFLWNEETKLNVCKSRYRFKKSESTLQASGNPCKPLILRRNKKCSSLNQQNCNKPSIKFLSDIEIPSHITDHTYCQNYDLLTWTPSNLNKTESIPYQTQMLPSRKRKSQFNLNNTSMNLKEGQPLVTFLEPNVHPKNNTQLHETCDNESKRRPTFRIVSSEIKADISDTVATSANENLTVLDRTKEVTNCEKTISATSILNMPFIYEEEKCNYSSTKDIHEKSQLDSMKSFSNHPKNKTVDPNVPLLILNDTSSKVISLTSRTINKSAIVPEFIKNISQKDHNNKTLLKSSYTPVERLQFEELRQKLTFSRNLSNISKVVFKTPKKRPYFNSKIVIKRTKRNKFSKPHKDEDNIENSNKSAKTFPKVIKYSNVERKQIKSSNKDSLYKRDSEGNLAKICERTKNTNEVFIEKRMDNSLSNIISNGEKESNATIVSATRKSLIPDSIILNESFEINHSSPLLSDYDKISEPFVYNYQPGALDILKENKIVSDENSSTLEVTDSIISNICLADSEIINLHQEQTLKHNSNIGNAMETQDGSYDTNRKETFKLTPKCNPSVEFSENHTLPPLISIKTTNNKSSDDKILCESLHYNNQHGVLEKNITVSDRQCLTPDVIGSTVSDVCLADAEMNDVELDQEATLRHDSNIEISMKIMDYPFDAKSDVLNENTYRKEVAVPESFMELSGLNSIRNKEKEFTEVCPQDRNETPKVNKTSINECAMETEIEKLNQEPTFKHDSNVFSFANSKDINENMNSKEESVSVSFQLSGLNTILSKEKEVTEICPGDKTETPKENTNSINVYSAGTEINTKVTSEPFIKLPCLNSVPSKENENTELCPKDRIEKLKVKLNVCLADTEMKDGEDENDSNILITTEKKDLSFDTNSKFFNENLITKGTSDSVSLIELSEPNSVPSKEKEVSELCPEDRIKKPIENINVCITDTEMKDGEDENDSNILITTDTKDLSFDTNSKIFIENKITSDSESLMELSELNSVPSKEKEVTELCPEDKTETTQINSVYSAETVMKDEELNKKLTLNHDSNIRIALETKDFSFDANSKAFSESTCTKRTSVFGSQMEISELKCIPAKNKNVSDCCPEDIIEPHITISAHTEIKDGKLNMEPILKRGSNINIAKEAKNCFFETNSKVLNENTSTKETSAFEPFMELPEVNSEPRKEKEIIELSSKYQIDKRHNTNTVMDVISSCKENNSPSSKEFEQVLTAISLRVTFLTKSIINNKESPIPEVVSEVLEMTSQHIFEILSMVTDRARDFSSILKSSMRNININNVVSEVLQISSLLSSTITLLTYDEFQDCSGMNDPEKAFNVDTKLKANNKIVVQLFKHDISNVISNLNYEIQNLSSIVKSTFIGSVEQKPICKSSFMQSDQSISSPIGKVNSSVSSLSQFNFNKSCLDNSETSDGDSNDSDFINIHSKVAELVDNMQEPEEDSISNFETDSEAKKANSSQNKNMRDYNYLTDVEQCEFDEKYYTDLLQFCFSNNLSNTPQKVIDLEATSSTNDTEEKLYSTLGDEDLKPSIDTEINNVNSAMNCEDADFVALDNLSGSDKLVGSMNSSNMSLNDSFEHSLVSIDRVNKSLDVKSMLSHIEFQDGLSFNEKALEIFNSSQSSGKQPKKELQIVLERCKVPERKITNQTIKKRKSKCCYDFVDLNCYICGLECRDWEYHESHTSNEHSSPPGVTCVCGKILNSKIQIQTHARKHGRNALRSAASGMSDTASNHIKFFRCGFCQDKCRTWTTLTSHCERVHKSRPATKCGQCEVNLTSQINYQLHVISHEKNNKNS